MDAYDEYAAASRSRVDDDVRAEEVDSHRRIYFGAFASQAWKLGEALERLLEPAMVGIGLASAKV